jgi:hypothetical protein
MNPTSRSRAALNIHLLNDLQRENVLAGIAKVAPDSPLLQNPAIAASFASLTLKGSTLATNIAAVAESEGIFRASIGARQLARDVFDLELDNLKTLVENNSTSAADLTGMGFVPLVFNRSARTQPDPPAALLVRPGKARGKARVAVQGRGWLGRFVAEVSIDPIGPATWTALPGNGKERVLTGYPSGTRLWVRFAAVRWGLQSAWSEPVQVLIP